MKEDSTIQPRQKLIKLIHRFHANVECRLRLVLARITGKNLLLPKHEDRILNSMFQTLRGTPRF